MCCMSFHHIFKMIFNFAFWISTYSKISMIVVVMTTTVLNYLKFMFFIHIIFVSIVVILPQLWRLVWLCYIQHSWALQDLFNSSNHFFLSSFHVYSLRGHLATHLAQKHDFCRNNLHKINHFRAKTHVSLYIQNVVYQIHSSNMLLG